MPLNWPAPGIGSVSEYLASATPWVTSSQVTSGNIHIHDFWRVTSFIQVSNTDPNNNLQVAFTRNGLLTTGSMYFEIPPKTILDTKVRVTTLFIRGSGSGKTPYSVLAGITAILPQNAPVLTGTDATGNTGFHNVG